jgi:hypothetical protein
MNSGGRLAWDQDDGRRDVVCFRRGHHVPQGTFDMTSSEAIGTDERRYRPIIYVQGHAGSDSEIEDTVAEPYMGFALRMTKFRQSSDGNVGRPYLESPLFRIAIWTTKTISIFWCRLTAHFSIKILAVHYAFGKLFVSSAAVNLKLFELGE